MNDPRTASRRCALLTVAATLAMIPVLLAGCTTSTTFYAPPDPPPPKPPANLGLVAPLRGVGSAVSGKVSVRDRDDGVTLLVSGANLPPNQYRVSFNRDPNCTSPNGFSAGPPWAPPGLDPYNLIPLFWNPSGNAEGQAHIKGVRTANLAGRSVVIYWGSQVTDAEPGVPNNRAACGVFEPAGPGLLF